MPTRDPAKLEDAIAILDDYLGPDPVPAPPHVSAAWRTVRGEARRGRRISSSALPAAVDVAQHLAVADRQAASVKEHVAAALEAMSVFGDPRGSVPSEPPPKDPTQR